MKKSILICCASLALALVGCSQNEGGTGSSSEPSTPSSGASSSVTSTNQTPSSGSTATKTDTNTASSKP